jgi:hypothetical protein
MFEPGFGTSQEGEQKVVPFARPASDADVEPEG